MDIKTLEEQRLLVKEYTLIGALISMAIDEGLSEQEIVSEIDWDYSQGDHHQAAENLSILINERLPPRMK